MIMFLAICYVTPALAVGGVSLLFFEDVEWLPEGGLPAVLFLCGLFWPVTITTSLVVVLVFCARRVGGGFAVLWRALRDRRSRAAAEAQVARDQLLPSARVARDRRAS